MTDEAVRIERAKREQEYDPVPPKCSSCVYFKRQLLNPHTERVITTRRGKKKVVKVNLPASRTNPKLDMCTFGNFEVRPYGVCNEWHSHTGEKIDV